MDHGGSHRNAQSVPKSALSGSYTGGNASQSSSSVLDEVYPRNSAARATAPDPTASTQDQRPSSGSHITGRGPPVLDIIYPYKRRMVDHIGKCEGLADKVARIRKERQPLEERILCTGQLQLQVTLSKTMVHLYSYCSWAGETPLPTPPVQMRCSMVRHGILQVCILSYPQKEVRPPNTLMWRLQG